MTPLWSSGSLLTELAPYVMDTPMTYLFLVWCLSTESVSYQNWHTMFTCVRPLVFISEILPNQLPGDQSGDMAAKNWHFCFETSTWGNPQYFRICLIANTYFLPSGRSPHMFLYVHHLHRINVMGWQNRLKFSGKTNRLKILLQNAYFYYFGQFRVFL